MSFYAGFSDELVKLGKDAGKAALKNFEKTNPWWREDFAKAPRWGKNLTAQQRFAVSRGASLKKKASVARSAGKAYDKASGPIKELLKLKEKDPGRYHAVLRSIKSDSLSSTAKGVGLGIAGYRGAKGLGYRHKETGKREPMTGALKGIASGLALGAPLLLLAKHRALRQALLRTSRQGRK